MLPDYVPRNRWAITRLLTASCLTVLTAIFSGCSSLPPTTTPPHRDYGVNATYLIGEDGKLCFPSTTQQLIVRSITLTPHPTGEEFQDNERWFLYPEGTKVHVRAKLRAYAIEGGGMTALQDLLPGATLLPLLDAVK